MKRPIGALLWGMLALCLAGGHALAANGVQNPSFSGGMEGWSRLDQGGFQPLKPEVDRGVFRGSDMASLRLRVEPGMRGLVRQGAIPRDPRVSKYRFTVWVRCRGLHPDWIVRVGVDQCKGSATVRTLQNAWVSRSVDMEWTPTRIDVTVPEGATDLGVFIGLWYKDDLKETPPPGGGEVWFDDVSLEPVGAPAGLAAPSAAAARDGLEIRGLFPMGERGLFLPGAPVQLMLIGKSVGAAEMALDVTVGLKDFCGSAAASKAFHLTLAPGKEFREQLDLPAPDRQGFFCAEAVLSRGAELVAAPQTSFCVLPKPSPKDPYFVADVNGAESEVVAAMQWMGVAGRKIGVTHSSVPEEKRGHLVEYWKDLLATGYLSPYWNSGLLMIGNIYLGEMTIPKRYHPIIAERRKQGLFPYPDEYFSDFGDFVEAMAVAARSKVKWWVLSEEIDGTIGIPNLASGSSTAELMRYVLLSRICYQRLKKVDPECVVIGLAVSSDFNRTPRYPLVRQLLPDLRDFTDVLGPDLYTDNWNWCLEPSRGPEAGEMRAKLLETLGLQAGLGKSRSIAISERGYGMPYHLGPDHPLERQLADMTARSLILGKSVPQVLFFATHMMVSGAGYRVRNGATSSDAAPLLDMALWKSEPDPNGKYWYRPRSAVAAYATVARMLGGSTDAIEVLPQSGVYAYVFKRPETTVAAVWTTDADPCEMRLPMPAGAECVDLMGNARPLPAGTVALALSQSPLFLQAKVPPDALAEALHKASFPSRPAVRAEGYLVDLNTLSLALVNASSQSLPIEVSVAKVVGATVREKPAKVTLAPGARSRVDVPLVAADPAHLGAFEAQVKAGDQSLAVSGDLSATPVLPAPSGVKVDGDLSEWAKRVPLVLDDLQSLYPSRDAFTRGDWTGSKDLGVRAWLGWDERYLYLAARTTDDAHVQRQTGDKIWMDDCLQIAFDTLNDALSPRAAGKPGYDGNDYNLGIALTRQGPECTAFVERGAADSQGPRAYPLAIKRVGAETHYELAIPWDGLKPLQAKAGKAFGFSFVAFDVDGEAEKQASYWMGLTPGIANGQDPSAYQTFVLAR